MIRLSVLAIFGLLLPLLLSSCDDSKNDISELEKKIDSLLEERNIDLTQAVNSANAEQITEETELVTISTSIIEQVSRDKVSDAFDIMKKYSPLPEPEFNTIKEKTLEQFHMIKPRFGEFVGYEFIGSEKIGASLIRHDCIVKCENHVLRWEFYYYKPREKWFLNTFKWDDNIRLIKK